MSLSSALSSRSSMLPEQSTIIFDASWQDSQQRFLQWLSKESLVAESVEPLFGFTNHVFRVLLHSVTSWPSCLVIRVANRQLPKGLNPLADDFETIIAVHQLAAELGLAPKVLAVDGDCQLMALADCGVARPIQPTDMPQIAKRAQQLQRAGIAWSKMIPKPSKTALREWSLLGDIATSCRPSAEQAQQLIVLGESTELSTLPVVPSHSDWNPGNWLHDGQRWWLIDWDFAGWRPALWDWASLVVEHDWSWEQAALWLSPPVIEQQRLLPWFCATLSLISSDWHRQRGSNPATMIRAQQRSDYWLSVAEDQSMTNRTDRK